MKAQAAMETILIYSSAVLIITLSLGALVQYGVLDISRLLPERCTAGTGITCGQFLVSNDQGEQNNDLVQVELRNDGEADILVTSLSIAGEGEMQGMWGEGCSLQKEQLIANSNIELFTLAGCDIGIPPGGRIKGKLRLGYQVGASQVFRSAEGVIDAVVLGILPVLLSPDCISSSEICDGMDNDCDGVTDEELGSKSCGIGACMATVPFCANGVEQACIPFQPAQETIGDGLDNDCNGKTDDAGCECSIPNECSDGKVCTGCFYIPVGPEITCSDGMDNDCNAECDYAGCANVPRGDRACSVMVIS